MASNNAKFTLRTDGTLLRKFRYIAEYNARSANRELEVLMRQCISEFEKTHSVIDHNIINNIPK